MDIPKGLGIQRENDSSKRLLNGILVSTRKDKT